MTMAPRVSVIIPHLNTPGLLARCLASLTSQTLDHGRAEIIVVDNGSTSTPEAICAAAGARLCHEPAPGPGLARNRGAAAAMAPVLAFIDADCVAAPGWLQTLVTALEQTPLQPVGGDIRIAVAAPPRMTGIEAYESVFGFRQHMYIRARRFSVTANLGMTAEVLTRVGPFGDIDIAEDLDWGQRAHALGHATRFVPDMLVWHPARDDMAALRRKWQRHIRHEFQASGARAGPAWWLKALALALSGPLESGRLLTSDRLHGAGNRLRGIGTLVGIRLFRAAEMVRIARAPGQAAAPVWNRA